MFLSSFFFCLSYDWTGLLDWRAVTAWIGCMHGVALSEQRIFFLGCRFVSAFPDSSIILLCLGRMAWDGKIRVSEVASLPFYLLLLLLLLLPNEHYMSA